MIGLDSNLELIASKALNNSKILITKKKKSPAKDKTVPKRTSSSKRKLGDDAIFSDENSPKAKKLSMETTGNQEEQIDFDNDVFDSEASIKVSKASFIGTRRTTRRGKQTEVCDSVSELDKDVITEEASNVLAQPIKLFEDEDVQLTRTLRKRKGYSYTLYINYNLYNFF